MYAYFYLLNKTIKAQECDPASLTGGAATGVSERIPQPVTRKRI